MRGSDAVSGSLFSYIDLEDRVPVKHPLWLVLEIVNEALLALDAEFAKMYAALGRPSIPPERLLRGSLLQAFYTIRSERQLMEQLDYNLLFRWFVGLAATRSIVKSRRRRRGGALSAFFQSEMGRRGTSESAVSVMRKAEMEDAISAAPFLKDHDMRNFQITEFTRVIEPVAGGVFAIEKQLQAVSPYHDQRLTSKQAARYLGISPGTLARWRAERRSPVYLKAAGKYGAVAYAFSELVAWQQQRRFLGLSNGGHDELVH